MVFAQLFAPQNTSKIVVFKKHGTRFTDVNKKNRNHLIVCESESDELQFCSKQENLGKIAVVSKAQSID